MIFLQLILTFFEIGLFGFGGGYGMISLIQAQVVTHHAWLTTAEFTNVIAISQMTPGPIGINSATYCGYVAVQNAGYAAPFALLGSLAATTSVMLPSVILMILIAKMLLRYMNHHAVVGAFRGLRPTVVGLLIAAVLALMTEENFSSPHVNAWQFYISVFLFAATFVGTMFFKVNPIKMIGLAAFAGIMLL
ncbi:MAG: chromate transporter [Prevotella sp.]|nr:chromate transporter [Prevotella sp.]